MAGRRVEKGVARGCQFHITVDGESVVAYEGETVAAALLAAGRLVLRHTLEKKQPRGVYCGIGLCYDCAMEINGVADTRACQTLATPGCVVVTPQSRGGR